VLTVESNWIKTITENRKNCVGWNSNDKVDYKDFEPFKLNDKIKEIINLFTGFQAKQILDDDKYDVYNLDNWLTFFMDITDTIRQQVRTEFTSPSSFRLMDITQSFHMVDSTMLKELEKSRLDM
jgi:hypothetical protein